MNDSTSSDAWQAFRRVYWSLAAALAALLVLLALMGFGPGGHQCATRAALENANPEHVVVYGPRVFASPTESSS